MVIFLTWRNYMNYRREQRCRQTPAILKGMLERPLRVQEVRKERLFQTRIASPERWAEYYERLVVTPVPGRKRRPELKYAC
jgi:hypothetical protein